MITAISIAAAAAAFIAVTAVDTVYDSTRITVGCSLLLMSLSVTATAVALNTVGGHTVEIIISPFTVWTAILTAVIRRTFRGKPESHAGHAPAPEKAKGENGNMKK